MWQDSTIKFDISASQMKMRIGEKLIDKLDLIEDTKGNAGDRGRLIITNLRIIWQSIEYPRINLSIGFKNFVSVSTKHVNTLYRGTTQALHIMTSYGHVRYEFIFTNLDPRSTRHYTSVMGVHKAYASSHIYRELKLRAGIVHEKRLVLLPQEKVYDNILGVWNLSSEQGNIGTFVVTNIRLVWFADQNHQFNMSMSYFTVASVNLKNSKFGRTLVITSTEVSGGYVLGFKVEPVEKIQTLYKQILSLLAAYKKAPIFGIEYTVEFPQATIHQTEQKEETPDEFETSKDELSNIISAYFSEGGATQRKPIFSHYLGLAAEEPIQGSTLESLWQLVPSSK